MILPSDYSKCTGSTSKGISCHMKQNCKRYLSYTLDDDAYVSVITAPDCIEHTPLECPLKIQAHNESK
jgi:hypothetical protein